MNRSQWLRRIGYTGFGIALLAIATCDVSEAGDWDDLLTYNDVTANPQPWNNNTAGTLPNLTIPVTAFAPGYINQGSVAVPLDEFARAGATDEDIAAVSKQVDKNTKQIAKNTQQLQQNAAAIEANAAKIDRLEEENNSSIAAMGAVDFQRPLPGKAMRLALGAAEYSDKAGVGLSLSVVKGSIDLAIGVGAAEDATVAKGSIGISFF